MKWVIIAENKDGNSTVAVITSNDGKSALRIFEKDIHALPLFRTVTVFPVDHYIGGENEMHRA